MDVPATIAEHYSHESSDPQQRKRKAHKLTEQPPPRDPTLQDPKCVYQILRSHYAAYTPEMVEQVSGCPRETFLEGRRDHLQELRAGKDDRLVLRGRLDPPHHRGPDDPRGGHHPDAARQHRPARRRHSGPARPFEHPGQYRHPHPVQHAAGLFAPAERAQAAQDAGKTTWSSRHRQPAGGTTFPSTSSACCAPGTATRSTQTASGTISSFRRSSATTPRSR